MMPPPDQPLDEPDIEPPMTRELEETNVDESARSERPEGDGTVDEETRRMSSDLGPSDFGPGSLAFSTGGTPVAGGPGKIEPKQVLFGKYRVVRKLGGGAMGDVWLVDHASLKNQHALKLIVSNIASNEVALKRFQREFEVMASLDHPHAVRIFDACIGDSGGYIDMEYVQGQTLHDLLNAARKRPDRDPSGPLMPLDWIVRILDQLTDVLQEAHEKRIVHRDLKPSNLMLLDGRKPGKEYLKVLDFGIAKIRDDPSNAVQLTLTQGFIGTPSYGSPEQAMSREDIDGRSDIYSVGVLLYEFVTGHLPFKGVHFQVMHQHASVLPPSFAEINPGMGPLPELERAILRALAKDRGERPQTARELFEDVRLAVEAIQGPAPPITATPSSWEVVRADPPGSGSGTGRSLPATEPGGDHGPKPGGSGTFGGTIVDGGGPRTLPPRRPIAKPPTLEPVPPPGRSRSVVLALVACSVLAIVSMAALIYFLVGPKVTAESTAGGTKPGPPKTKGPVSPGPTFYPPEGYAEVAGEEKSGAYPAFLRRKSDNFRFHRFSDGVYLPEGYSPVDKDDLVDGWPRQITRDDDKTQARFVRIRGNKEWNIGAWDVAPNADQFDAPAHPVYITSGFYMMETEVTNGQFLAYITGKYRPSAWEAAYEARKEEDREQAANHPAVSLSRKMAIEYGYHVRAMLPTEAQWEYAARSLGKEHKYVGGKSPPTRDSANISRLNKLTTAPVGSFPRDRTEQGLLDMTGNVREMCRDVWRRYAKPGPVQVDPCEGPGDASPIEYVIRGGFFASLPDECATTRRDEKQGEEETEATVGFRLVIECPDARPR